jgi:hypothetical protein
MSCLTSDINVFICQKITFEHPTATVCRVYSDLGGLNFFFLLSLINLDLYTLQNFYSQDCSYNIAVNFIYRVLLLQFLNCMAMYHCLFRAPSESYYACLAESGFLT